MHTFDLPLTLSFGSNAGFMRITYDDKCFVQSMFYHVAHWDIVPAKIPVNLLGTTLFEELNEKVKAAVKNNYENLVLDHNQTTLS